MSGLLDDLTNGLKALGVTFLGQAKAETLTKAVGAVSPGVGAAASLVSQAQQMLSGLSKPAYADASKGIATISPADTELQGLQKRYDNLKRWANVLASSDRLMAQKAGATNLSQAVSTWNSGVYSRAMSALDSAMSMNRSITSRVNAGEMPDMRAGDAYISKRQEALAAADSADSYASRIQKAIEDAYSKYAASGSPSVVSFALAPVTGTVDAAKAVGGFAATSISRVGDAGSALLRATEGAADKTGTILKWGAIAVGGVALLQLLSAGSSSLAAMRAVSATYSAAKSHLGNPFGGRRRRRRSRS